MKQLAQFEDDIWEKQQPLKLRNTVRAIAFRDDRKFAFLRIKGEDEFGKRNHLETIGGGIEANESMVEAMKREVMEEIGYTCEVLDEIGVVVDTYHLIHRKTISHFFVVQLLEDQKATSRTALETSLIAGIEWLSFQEAYERLSAEADGINKLIHRRDLAALEAFFQRFGISY